VIDPRSKIDGTTPELRHSEHFYSETQPAIIDFCDSEKATSQCAA
jgi:hypothetical protein